MDPVAKFLHSPRVRAAHARHKDDLTAVSALRKDATPVETTLPDADAREQVRRLNAAGVFCLEAEDTNAGTRVVYAVPAGVRLGRRPTTRTPGGAAERRTDG